MVFEHIKCSPVLTRKISLDIAIRLITFWNRGCP